MQIDIIGTGELNLKNAVFDYNGTLALDGRIPSCVKTRLIRLAEIMTVYVLTADTNNNAQRECMGLPLSLTILKGGETAMQKAGIVSELNAEECVCFGNGFNDIEMFKLARLSVAVMGEEGVSGKLLSFADIVVNNIAEGIDLLFNKNRIVATLRA